MKTLLATLSFALAAGVGTVHAQSAAGPGAVLGAVAGGLIGGHNHDQWAEGAVIGGVAGALIGAAVSQPTAYQSVPVYQAPDYSYAQPAEQPPVVYSQPALQVVYTQPAPQVVYSQPAPTVVYAPAPAPVIYGPSYCAPAPAVNFGFRYYSGPRYEGRGNWGHGYYGHSEYHHYRRW